MTRDGRWFGIRQATLKPSLPEEVDRIDVGAFQLMPSIFVVTFDVCLNEKATAKLSRSHDRRYLPEIRFAELIPSGFMARSAKMADDVMSEEIFHWFEELRGKVENCLKPYANDYFMQHSSARIARLPAFEVFVVKGVGEMKNGLSEWLRESHMWLRSFGFDPGFLTYTNEEVVLLPSEDSLWWNKSAKSPHRLIILWEPYANAKGKDGNNRTNGSVIHHTQFLLSDILPFFAVLEFLGFVQRRIEDLRQRVFRQVNSGWFKKILLGPQTGLNDRILQESFLLDRLITEFRQHESFISRMERFSEDAARLKSLQASAEGVQRSLKDDLHETTKHRMQMLRENATLIKDWFSQYSALRTTEATSWMTLILVILTVVLVWLTYELAQPH